MYVIFEWVYIMKVVCVLIVTLILRVGMWITFQACLLRDSINEVVHKTFTFI